MCQINAKEGELGGRGWASGDKIQGCAGGGQHISAPWRSGHALPTPPTGSHGLLSHLPAPEIPGRGVRPCTSTRVPVPVHACMRACVHVCVCVCVCVWLGGCQLPPPPQFSCSTSFSSLGMPSWSSAGQGKHLKLKGPWFPGTAKGPLGFRS
jgi:hypothetical protein